MSRIDLADGLRLIHAARGDERFGHEAHLRFAWSLLDEADRLADAERVACQTIRHAAELAGTPDKYHCTVTLFWIRLVDHVRRTHPEVALLTDAIETYPDLRNPHLPDRYWSDVDSEEAKTHWVDPDLAPMP